MCAKLKSIEPKVSQLLMNGKDVTVSVMFSPWVTRVGQESDSKWTLLTRDSQYSAKREAQQITFGFSIGCFSFFIVCCVVTFILIKVEGTYQLLLKRHKYVSTNIIHFEYIMLQQIEFRTVMFFAHRRHCKLVSDVLNQLL